jgi:hypothetical protein
MASGIGFVDVAVSFGGPLHLIELKVLKTKLTGAGQLAAYMGTEGRGSGWLVLIDARGSSHRGSLPAKINAPTGVIMTVAIDVNPAAPHAT